MKRRAELPLGRTIDEFLDEYSPRARAFIDAQTRAALRPVAVETDVRKIFLSNFVKNFPNVKGRALCLVLDEAEIPVLPQWARDANSRLWTDCWAHAATKNLVRKYLSAERRKALNLITGA
jgi:hypothetical protein